MPCPSRRGRSASACRLRGHNSCTCEESGDSIRPVRRRPEWGTELAKIRLPPKLSWMTPAVWALAVIVVFAGASFFFALAETSLLSLGKWQVSQLAQLHSRRGRVVQRLLAEPQDLLATISLGN